MGVFFQQIIGAYAMLGLISLVSMVWIMVLLGVAVSNVHEISGGSAAGVVILSALIYMVVSVVLGIVISMTMAAGMASMFGAAASGMH